MWELIWASMRTYVGEAWFKWKRRSILGSIDLKNPKTILYYLGDLTKFKIQANPFVRTVLTAKRGSKKWVKAYSQIRKNKQLASFETVRSIMDITDIKDPTKLIKDLKEEPQKIVNKLIKAPKEKVKQLYDASNEDSNLHALSSSWLAYGTYVPLLNNPKKVILKLTTKTGAKFKTPVINKNIWDKMVKQIGVTVYEKGKRVGASYGAGTILHKYVPRRTWRKVMV